MAGWASVNEGTQGPPIWDVVGGYLTKQKTVAVSARDTVKLVRG